MKFVYPPRNAQVCKGDGGHTKEAEGGAIELNKLVPLVSGMREETSVTPGR